MASIFSAVSTLLKPRTERDASVYEVISRVRTRVETEVPAVRTEFIQILQDLIAGLAGTPSPVEIKLFHPDLRIAERASAAVADAIESVPGLVDLYNGVAGDVPEMRVDLDPVSVSRDCSRRDFLGFLALGAVTWFLR